MIVSRPVNATEPDLLLGLEHAEVTVCQLDGTVQRRVPAPPEGWTHEALEAAAAEWGPVWDAFIADQWIGSSEV